MGKTEAWSKAEAPAPPGIAELMPSNSPPNTLPIWKGDLAQGRRGVEILGSPIGTAAYTSARAAARLAEEQLLINAIEQIPSLQASWLLLLFCGAPRANHLLRTTPPALLHTYSHGHDATILKCFK